MKKILLIIIFFIFNSFAADLKDRMESVHSSSVQRSSDVKDAADRKSSAEAQEIRLPQTQKEIVNQQDLNGNTPLHNAVNQGDVQIIKWLLTAGANPLIKNSNGKTAKDLAILNDLSGEIKDLLQDYEDLWIQNSEDLVRAAQLGDSKKVAEILRHGFVNINYKLKEAWTLGLANPEIYEDRDALTIAVINQSVEIIKLLIAADADVNTALGFARTTEIADLLINAGACSLDTLANAINMLFNRSGKLEILKLIIKKGGKNLLNHSYFDEPVYFMVMDRLLPSYKIQILKFLLDAGADLNLKGNDGLTFKGKLIKTLHDDPQFAKKNLYDQMLAVIEEYENKLKFEPLENLIEQEEARREQAFQEHLERVRQSSLLSD